LPPCRVSTCFSSFFFYLFFFNTKRCRSTALTRIAMGWGWKSPSLSCPARPGFCRGRPNRIASAPLPRNLSVLVIEAKLDKFRQQDPECTLPPINHWLPDVTAPTTDLFKRGIPTFVRCFISQPQDSITATRVLSRNISRLSRGRCGSRGIVFQFVLLDS
jgi:hypothetical protein